MEKTKLGISVGFLAAAVYVAALAGYVPVIILGLYVLIREDNEWLKRMAIKAVAVLMCFTIFFTCIGFIPSICSWINSLIGLFDGYIDLSIVTGIVSLITSLLYIVEDVFLVILAAKALSVSTIRIPVIDDLLIKYI